MPNLIIIRQCEQKNYSKKFTGGGGGGEGKGVESNLRPSVCFNVTTHVTP